MPIREPMERHAWGRPLLHHPHAVANVDTKKSKRKMKTVKLSRRKNRKKVR